MSILLFLFSPLFVFADTARSSIVMDIDSGRVLYSNRPDEVRLIASITKIMTAVLAIESGKLDQEVTVGEEVLKMYGTSIYIMPGEKMSLRDLVYGLLLRSGNDAAMVIATYLGGTEEKFVAMMNEKAKMIGMKNTTFQNPHGLDEETENLSTARDMALLSRYAYQLKEYRTISKTYQHSVSTGEKTYLWYNRNKLLKTYEYATGGKNGYTPRAGKTLVTTAEKDGLRLTAVSLKDGNPFENHEELYEKIFEKYHAYKIVDAKTFKLSSPFIEGTAYIKQSYSYPLQENEKKKIHVVAKIPKENKNTTGKVGMIEIKFEDALLKEIPIYQEIKEKKESFWEKLKHFFTKS